jgi:hypothetical protein
MAVESPVADSNSESELPQKRIAGASEVEDEFLSVC